MTDLFAGHGAARVFDPWLTAWISGDVWSVTRAPAERWRDRRLRRLHELLSCAVDGSAWWRERLRGVALQGATAEDLLQRLPVLHKHELMAHFDAAVTDRAVRRADAQAFARSSAATGGAYLGRYLVWESSGSSGEPALFVQDAHSLAVGDALSALRGPVAQLAPADAGSRIALVGAIDGPFASIVSLQRWRALNPWIAASTRPFSLLQPVETLVAQLNDWQPRVLATYPSMAWVLAQQQLAGALKLALHAVWTGGETLGSGCRETVARAFACPVRDSYGASECLEIAAECPAGALHLNADWVILEPVDREDRPVPPGSAGATTLLTNLANRVQPILRYDIGDRVRCRPGTCRCGCTLPVIEVEGRCDDILTLAGPAGRTVHLAPLALSTVMEDEAGVHAFRIEQHGPATLRVELHGADGASAARRQRVRDVLLRYLRGQGLAHAEVTVHVGGASPLRGPSGKLVRIVRVDPGRSGPRRAH